MSIVGHGIDLVECERIGHVLERHGDRFMKRILTAAELEYAGRFADPVPHVAGRFAAKEAILKMLGTGLRGQIGWTDIEIMNDMLGQPQVTFRGECERIASERGVACVLLSISHTHEHATASAIGVGPT